MTKIKPKTEDLMTPEQLFNGLVNNSPYASVALKYFQLKGVQPNDDEHYSIADLLEAYHALAKVDHVVNKIGDENEEIN